MAFLQLIFVIHLFVGFIAILLTWSIIERDWLDSLAGAAGYGFFVTMMTGQPLMILGFIYGYFHRRVARIVDDEVDE